MLDDVLKAYYYNQADGTPDENIPILKDCFEKCIYVVAKYKHQISNLYYFFSNDTTLCFYQNNDGQIKDFRVNEPPTLGKAFNIRNQIMKGPEAVAVIEDLLDRGEILMVQTLIEWIPFWKIYQPEYEPKDYFASHIFILVGHDKDNYYYVEEKRNLNPANFVPYESNNEIGIIKKEKMRPSLEYYVKIFMVESNIFKPEEFDNLFLGVIREIVKNYGKSSEAFDNHKLFYGREAYKQLIALCEAEKTNLNDNIYLLNYVWILQDILRWKIYLDVINRRKLLQKSMLFYFDRMGLNTGEKIFPIMEELNQTWEKLKNKLEYKYIRKMYLMDSQIGKYFNKIMDLEDQMVEFLSGYFC